MADQFIREHSDITQSVFASMNSISQSILNAPINSTSQSAEPASTIPFTYKSACLELFNVPFRSYKHHKNQDQKVRTIGREQYLDYEIFCDILTGIELLKGLIKYAVWRHHAHWDELCAKHKITSTQELLDIEINIPQNNIELIALFTAYPWAIDDLHLELFKIINLEQFQFMRKLCKINRFLYFNTFPEPEDGDPILECENDVTELMTTVKILVRRLLKYHIEIAKIIEPQSDTQDVGMEEQQSKPDEFIQTGGEVHYLSELSPNLNIQEEPPAKIRKVS